ncbi:MAG: hypothetical protein N2044_12395 [Cyclobacteriaceae bacterium]|nr:hypothetical protein [Cyclobacteriaceae bacterium]MCX7638637.1 hypothetical protein [Cyclobacteriaceae bacterium]MDW8332517.1 hypothetical protein [Cyclobacteriaceae bacterium]
MKAKANDLASRRKNLGTTIYLNLLERAVKERTFLIIIGLAFILAAFATFDRNAAMWFGFLFAAYAAVANDSIQSLGTFIESNRHRPWYVLWLFTGLILIVTITFSFIYFDGDVTYRRLLDAEGNTAYPHPEEFSYFQIIAPVVLLILTRLRMPVSTTFLLLSVFSASSGGVTSIVQKSVTAYVLAFILSFSLWYFGYNLIRKYFNKRKAHPSWPVIQWLISGALWSVWLMQDGANIAVFLPRTLSVTQFLIFTGTIFFGLGLLFYLRGDKIQQVVSEKIRISDVRAATLVDFTYVLLLIYKLLDSTVPLSTTWVFLGVIGGREIAINIARNKKGYKHKRKALKLIGRDLLYATIGLIVSVALAAGANPGIRKDVVDFLSGNF